MALSSEHSEIDAWRSAIVKDREIVEAEFEAMREFSQSAREAARTNKLLGKQEAAYRRVNQVSIL